MELIEPGKFYGEGPEKAAREKEIDEQRAKYGIAKADIICLHDYLGVVIANGLRMLAEYEHGWPGTEEFPTPEDWEESLINVAEKLEQASTRDEQIAKMHDEIDWEEGELDIPEDFNEWLNGPKTPAWEEYSRRSDEIETTAEKNAKEALEWLSKYWFALWD